MSRRKKGVKLFLLYGLNNERSCSCFPQFFGFFSLRCFECLVCPWAEAKQRLWVCYCILIPISKWEAVGVGFALACSGKILMRYMLVCPIDISKHPDDPRFEFGHLVRSARVEGSPGRLDLKAGDGSAAKGPGVGGILPLWCFWSWHRCIIWAETNAGVYHSKCHSRTGLRNHYPLHIWQFPCRGHKVLWHLSTRRILSL